MLAKIFRVFVGGTSLTSGLVFKAISGGGFPVKPLIGVMAVGEGAIIAGRLGIKVLSRANPPPPPMMIRRSTARDDIGAQQTSIEEGEGRRREI
jgi:hypothetical protein